MSKQQNRQVIIFAEQGQERILPANTQEELALSCFVVLKERYNNPIWGYKPQNLTLTPEENDFIEFWELESNTLPVLLKRHGDRIYDRLKENLKTNDDPDWIWYQKVEELLKLKPEVAQGYKISYGGRIVPTSYYLLLKRKEYPNESFVLADMKNG